MENREYNLKMIDYRITNIENELKIHYSEEQDHKNELIKTLMEIKIELATLKTKSSMWGFVAGSLPPIIMFLLELFKKG